MPSYLPREFESAIIDRHAGAGMTYSLDTAAQSLSQAMFQRIA
jgi:hypothetical protein